MLTVLIFTFLSTGLLKAQLQKDFDWGEESPVYSDNTTQVYISFFRSTNSCEVLGKHNRYRYRIVGNLKLENEKVISCNFQYVNCEGRVNPVSLNINIGATSRLGTKESPDFLFSGKLLSLMGNLVEDLSVEKKQSAVTDNHEGSQNLNSNSFTLKLKTNADCEVFLDAETRGILKPGEIKKIFLAKDQFVLLIYF